MVGSLIMMFRFHIGLTSRNAMKEAVEELADTSRKADFMMNAVNPFIRLVNRAGQAVIAVSAGKLLLDGVLTVGTFQAFFQYVYQASEPLTEAAYMINSLQSSIASVERIFRLLDEKEIRPEPDRGKVRREQNETGTDNTGMELQENEGGWQKAGGRGQVRFEHVHFGYAPNHILMKDISFTAEPGRFLHPDFA